MEMQKPASEHEWLKKLLGEWASDGEVMMEPGKPPVKTKGSESTRELGPFWIITEMSSSHADPGENPGGCGDNFSGVMQLGYDPKAGQFIGSFIDCMGSHMWNYTGHFNDRQTAVVLQAEGAGPDGKPITVRETIELVSDNQRSFTSEFKMEDGSWFKVVDIKATRK